MCCVLQVAYGRWDGTVSADSSFNGTDLRRIGINPNFWYPLARSTEVKPGKMLGVTFAGEPIVLARSSRAELFALEDRCPHRQVPLHWGVVEGDSIKCGYHAWRFERNGRCSIPYLAEGDSGPLTGVRSYPVREAYGLAFVFPGDRALAQRVALPELPLFGSPDHIALYYTPRVRCHYMFMHENLIDMNHAFLHRRTMGWVRAALLDYQHGDTWVEVRYLFGRDPGARHLKGADFMIRGGKDARNRAGDDTSPADPDHELMTIRTEYPYQRLSVRAGGSDLPAFELWAAYVPVDREQVYNQSFGILLIRKPRIPGLIYLLLPFIRYFTDRVLGEDQMAVEGEQRAWDEQGEDRNYEVFPPSLGLREVLARNGVPLFPARAQAVEHLAVVGPRSPSNASSGVS